MYDFSSLFMKKNPAPSSGITKQAIRNNDFSEAVAEENIPLKIEKKVIIKKVVSDKIRKPIQSRVSMSEKKVDQFIQPKKVVVKVDQDNNITTKVKQLKEAVVKITQPKKIVSNIIQSKKVITKIDQPKNSIQVKININEIDIQPEHFFILNGGACLKNLKDLHTALDEMSQEQFDFHTKRDGSDFAKWVEGVFGEVELAKRIEKAKTKEDLAKIIANYIN